MCFLTDHNAFALSGRNIKPITVVVASHHLSRALPWTGGFWPFRPSKKRHIVFGANSPVITGLLDKDEAAQEATIRQIYDLALLSKNLLKGKDLSEFVKRNMEKL